MREYGERTLRDLLRIWQEAMRELVWGFAVATLCLTVFVTWGYENDNDLWTAAGLVVYLSAVFVRVCLGLTFMFNGRRIQKCIEKTGNRQGSLAPSSGWRMQLGTLTLTAAWALLSMGGGMVIAQHLVLAHLGMPGLPAEIEVIGWFMVGVSALTVGFLAAIAGRVRETSTWAMWVGTAWVSFGSVAVRWCMISSALWEPAARGRSPR